MLKSILLGVALYLAATLISYAHSWYDVWCCNDRDCNVIPIEELSFTAEGIVWSNKQGSELFPYGDSRIKPSQDGDYHGCQLSAEAEFEKRCLYIPLSG